MRHEKGIDVLQSRSRGARSAFVCSYLINPLALKKALGKNFPYNALMLFSGEKSVDLDRSIRTRKFLDGSSIPLFKHVFHSKLYLFEHGKEDRRKLNLIVASFNATSAGLSQNLEFWIEGEAEVDLSGFGVQNLVELVTDSSIDIDAVSWEEFCFENHKQLVVSPALEVLWRLAQNGVGLAPGTPKCIPDLVISEKRYHNYDSILVHTLGNNSLAKAIEIMIREVSKNNNNVTIRVLSPYHNLEGLKYLRDVCIQKIGKRNISITMEILTVFPPDFSNKFGDPKKQPFASIKEIRALSSADERVNLHLKLWKRDSNLQIANMDRSLDEPYIQNVFLHAKAILVKSKDRCQCLIGSPNMTGAAIGKGPDLNFETALWERRHEAASRLWEEIGILFRQSSEAIMEDYNVLKTWTDFFNSGQRKPESIVTGSRDTLERYLQFFVKKDAETLPLSVQEESTVYYDEISRAQLLVVLKSGAPKISPRAKIYFVPSKLEKTTSIEARFEGEKLKTNLLLDRAKPDTILVSIDIESRLLEEYKVNVKKKGSQLEVISHNILNWDSKNEEAALLVETRKGPVEIRCIRKRNGLYAKKPSSKVMIRKALLRIYSRNSKNTIHRNSFGYFKIRYRKREPKFDAKIACITPFPFSVYLEELHDPLCARILPDSVSVSLLTKDNEEVTTIPLATRTVSDSPLAKSFLMRFRDTDSSNLREMCIELRFEDEHEGYYDFVLPPQRLGYSQIAKEENIVFLPRDVATEVFLVSPSTKKRLVPISIEDGFNRFVIPSVSFISDLDDDKLWILEDFITPFYSVLRNQHISYFPERANIVDSAPFGLEVSRLDVPGSLARMCKKVLLRWWVRRWGYRGRGVDKNTHFAFPLRFQILPSEIEYVRQAFDLSKEPFEGYLDIELHCEMEGGYDLLHKKETLRIMRTDKFIEGIEGRVWSYLKNREQLIFALMELFHSSIMKEAPFELFRNVIKGDESSRFILTQEYGCSPMISHGSPEFLVECEKCEQLLDESFKLTFESFFIMFATEPKLPKIPKDVLKKVAKKRLQNGIKSLLVRQTFENYFITPGKLFEKFDPKWKLYL